MARRRARAPQAVQTRAVSEELPVSARVAWSYLASLLATVAAAGVVVITNQSLAVALCHAPTATEVGDCKFGWMIWSGLFGFLLALVPVALQLRLGWLFLAAMWAEVGLWLAADAIGQWWWWAAALTLPGVAALISSDWGRGQEFRRWQLVGLGILLAAAVGAVAWWYSHT